MSNASRMARCHVRGLMLHIPQKPTKWSTKVSVFAIMSNLTNARNMLCGTVLQVSLNHEWRSVIFNWNSTLVSKLKIWCSCLQTWSTHAYFWSPFSAHRLAGKKVIGQPAASFWEASHQTTVYMCLYRSVILWTQPVTLVIGRCSVVTELLASLC